MSDNDTISNPMGAEDVTILGKSPTSSAQQYPPLRTPEATHSTVELQIDTPSTRIAPAAIPYGAASLSNSPEPPQTDLQGHYIGPASGVSFLLRMQKRLEQSISFSHDSSIFTFGDAPLHPPEFDPSFCIMLPREDA